jgi:hypothetical protein
MGDYGAYRAAQAYSILALFKGTRRNRRWSAVPTDADTHGNGHDGVSIPATGTGLSK